MRPSTFLAAALGILSVVAPALARVQPGDPNAANSALASQGQARAAQQVRVAQADTTRMDLERGRTAAPPPSGGMGMGAAPRGIR